MIIYYPIVHFYNFVFIFYYGNRSTFMVLIMGLDIKSLQSSNTILPFPQVTCIKFSNKNYRFIITSSRYDL